VKAAVVTAFDTPPRYEDIDAPTPAGPADFVIDIVAAGLHPRVRSQADGSRYTSTDELPLIPGIDGVGRGPDRRLRYFVLPDTTRGSMAEQTVVDERRSILLPEDADVIALAAAMNPAMSSWVALRRRIDFRAGQRVLVLGATGNAGRLAIQVARHLGASAVVAAGRDRRRLATLGAVGATATVALDADPDTVAEQLAEGARDVDVVLDYLWGEPAVRAMVALTAPEPRQKPLTWVQIGSVAGRSAAIPSAALRAARLEIVGSGQGSVSTAEILAELPTLAHEISAGRFTVDAKPVRLADVEQAWRTDAYPNQRVVLLP
jgi:NADPH:quinone reductase-like Zn-dependent oxidoreductase